MTLTTLYLFTTINPFFTRLPRHLYALRIYAGCAGALFSAHGLANQIPEQFMNLLYHARILPFPVIVVHRVPAAEFLWEHTPLASSSYKVHDAVPYHAQRNFAFTLVIQHIFNILPLAICYVSWVFFHRLFKFGCLRKLRKFFLIS